MKDYIAEQIAGQIRAGRGSRRQGWAARRATARERWSRVPRWLWYWTLFMLLITVSASLAGVAELIFH